jgi:hypothetical protein
MLQGCYSRLLGRYGQLGQYTKPADFWNDSSPNMIKEKTRKDLNVQAKQTNGFDPS